MPYDINETHDPKLESWVESANDPETDFPIQNLPLVCLTDEHGLDQSVGVTIGDQVLDLHDWQQVGLLRELASTTPGLHGPVIPTPGAATVNQLPYCEKLARAWVPGFVAPTAITPG